MNAHSLPVSAVAALVVAAMSLAGPGHAATNPPAPPGSHELPGTQPPVTSVVNASRVLATGILTDSSGQPVSGVPVMAYAYPLEIPSEEGAEFELTLLGTGTTSSTGAYRITPDYSPLRPVITAAGEAYAAGESVPVNINIVAFTGDELAAHGTTVSVAPDLRTASIDRASLEDTPSTATEPTVDLTLLPQAPAENPHDGASATAATMAAATLAKLPLNCTVQKSHGPRMVTVGQVSSTTASGYTAQFTHNKSASSTLGIGLKSSNGFSASGTTTVTNSVTTTYPKQTSNVSRSMRSSFVYATIKCHIFGAPAGYYAYEYRPISHAAGDATTSSTMPTALKCTPALAGSKKSISTSTATTFTVGANTKGDIGINLSARTGYTTNARIDYTFTKDRRLCGTNGYIGESPGRIVVRPPA